MNIINIQIKLIIKLKNKETKMVEFKDRYIHAVDLKFLCKKRLYFLWPRSRIFCNIKRLPLHVYSAVIINWTKRGRHENDWMLLFRYVTIFKGFFNFQDRRISLWTAFSNLEHTWLTLNTNFKNTITLIYCIRHCLVP